MIVRIAGYIRPTASRNAAGATKTTPCHFSPVRPLKSDARNRTRPNTAAKNAIAKNIRKNLPATLSARRKGSGMIPDPTLPRTFVAIDSTSGQS